MRDQNLVDKLETVWQSIKNLASTLTETEWGLPTDCPGWSVQDQLSHLVGSERRYIGHPEPDHTPQNTSNVKNEIGARNEGLVDRRRKWKPAEVIEEFNETTDGRIRSLREMSTEDFSATTQTPLGPGEFRDLLAIRIFDAWVHEQDIRRAVGKPGHLAGDVAQHSLGRITIAMPFIVGKKAQAPDGTTVTFTISGQTEIVLSIKVAGGRASSVDPPPKTPTVQLSMDFETFSCLGCGRWDPTETLLSGKVKVVGDTELGETIIKEMNFMP